MTNRATGPVFLLASVLMLSPPIAPVTLGQERESTVPDQRGRARFDVMAAGLRHAMEYARERETAERFGIEYFCIGVEAHGREAREDPGDPLLELFRGMRPTVVAVSECEFESSEEYRYEPREGTSSVDHRESGAEAMYFGVTPPDFERETAASLGVWYVVGPTHVVDFDCDVYRKMIWYAECRVSGRA